MQSIDWEEELCDDLEIQNIENWIFDIERWIWIEI